MNELIKRKVLLERSRFLQSETCEHKTLKTHKYSQSILFSCIHTAEHGWIHEGIKSRTTENLHKNCPNITVHTSGKFEVEWLTGRKNGFAQIFSRPRYYNPLFFDMRTWHLPSYVPDIYSSVFTYLRHTCKEKICEKPFFRSVAEKMEC